MVVSALALFTPTSLAGNAVKPMGVRYRGGIALITLLRTSGLDIDFDVI